MNPVYSCQKDVPAGGQRFSIAAVKMEEGVSSHVSKGSLQDLGKAGHALLPSSRKGCSPADTLIVAW